MNLGTIAVWSVLSSFGLISFLHFINHFTRVGRISDDAQFNLVTWGVILVAMIVTMKILAVAERANNQIRDLTHQLRAVRWGASLSAGRKARDSTAAGTESRSKIFSLMDRKSA